MVAPPGRPADGLSPAIVERHTRAWLETFVVGLNLCPFARPVLRAENLRIAVCNGAGEQALQQAFLRELDLLQRSSEAEIATSLLVFPDALAEFDDYLDFLELAQQLLAEAGLEGVIQLASFHPHYLFAGEAQDSAGHFSNRAPYPLIHLLREDMLTRVLADNADADEIPARNIATLEAIGSAQLGRRWLDLFS